MKTTQANAQSLQNPFQTIDFQKNRGFTPNSGWIISRIDWNRSAKRSSLNTLSSVGSYNIWVLVTDKTTVICNWHQLCKSWTWRWDEIERVAYKDSKVKKESTCWPLAAMVRGGRIWSQSLRQTMRSSTPLRTCCTTSCVSTALPSWNACSSSDSLGRSSSPYQPERKQGSYHIGDYWCSKQYQRMHNLPLLSHWQRGEKIHWPFQTAGWTLQPSPSSISNGLLNLVEN